MEQLGLFDVTQPLSDEEKAFRFIEPVILHAFDEENFDHGRLHFNPGTSYASVLIDSSTILQFKFGKKTRYFGSQYKYFREIEENYKYSIQPNAYVRFDICCPEDILNYAELVEHIVHNAINMLPIEFDCCNSFNDCSDAKQCVSKNKDFASGCRYRRILKSGRIFFGKNRNID